VTHNILGVNVAGGDGAPVRPRHAEKILAGELLHELRTSHQLQTEHWAKATSQIVNGCLEAGSQKLDASGSYALTFKTVIGSFVITNLTGAAIVVSAGRPGPSAPTIGNGVHNIPANFQTTVPIGDQSLTVWGPAAGLISYQAWTGLQPYGVIA
jgi:hypothetical protein